MTPEDLIQQLELQPVDFKQVMAVIDASYEFTPTAFTNGLLVNEANTNNGSCKILAFGHRHQLSEQATLNAFGDFYTQDVLENPQGQDHQNIRTFMKSGWAGVRFSSDPLTPRSSS